ncbi:unnamed protein product [Pipistrellus nathusii]|uniref:Uncharacterized protein n=1 Tax=Pipistrellus nathusii TaxID=59473 RepID=A0ABN9ZP60_PIPNA
MGQSRSEGSGKPFELNDHEIKEIRFPAEHRSSLLPISKKRDELKNTTALLRFVRERRARASCRSREWMDRRTNVGNPASQSGDSPETRAEAWSRNPGRIAEAPGEPLSVTNSQGAPTLM